MENVFYVYEHWRPDSNVCFYVGKGKHKRAWDMKNMRNRHFKAIVSRLTSLGLCVDVRIIASNLPAKEAFDLEVERIAFYGQENLANQTRGGDGLVNPSAATRLRISEGQRRRFSRPEEREAAAARRRGTTLSDETKKKVSLAGMGRRHSDAARAAMREFAKKRGISPATRAAQKAAVTGKKRAPFTDETRARMSEAQLRRYALKKQEAA
jgi:hypothetical protein